MARKKGSRSEKMIGFPEQETVHYPLDRDRIAEAALQLLHQMSLKELSMRKIASELNVKAAALYYHVKNKDELLQILADKISMEMGEQWSNNSLTWREQIVAWAQSFRKALKTYPNAVEVFYATISTSYNRLLQIERLFDVLVHAGFTDEQLPWASSMLKNYVLGFVSEEVRIASFAEINDVSGEDLSEKVAQVYEHLPKEQFPHMIRLAHTTTKPNWEKEFRFGIQVLLDGLAAQIENQNEELQLL